MIVVPSEVELQRSRKLSGRGQLSNPVADHTVTPRDPSTPFTLLRMTKCEIPWEFV